MGPCWWQVSDGFDDVRKKRLNELAQLRTGCDKPAVAVAESGPQSSIPPKSPAPRPATRVSNLLPLFPLFQIDLVDDTSSLFSPCIF